MSELRTVHFPVKDVPLRNDVSLLGQLLGETLIELHGPRLLAEVEAVRHAAIRMREGESGGADELEKLLQALGIDEIQQLVKAFSTYLRLSNVAEKAHRIRRRQAYLRIGQVRQRGSLDEVIANLAREGVAADDLASALDAVRIIPVFTAHPTEATRRTLLEKEYSILQRLVERLNPDLTPQEERQALDRIREAIQTAWQTSAVPGLKPTVADELDNVLFYLTEILYRVVPPFLESLDDALERNYGPEAVRADLGRVLRFGSWVGGDMDGNPNVNADTLLESLATQREAVMRCYIPELRRLARQLSQTRGQAGFSEAIETRLAEYESRLSQVAAGIPARHRDMPYRCLLRYVEARLEGTRRETDAAYAEPTEFMADLELVASSLIDNHGRNAGLFSVQRLLQRARTFGFHLASLDARQDARLHRDVLAELLGRPDWGSQDPDERSALLEALLLEGWSPAPDSTRSKQAASTLAVFAAIGQARKRYGNEATGLFIISMTQGPDDVLAALLLAGAAGARRNGRIDLDVAPLLETVQDLAAGPVILDRLLASPVYRQHLAERGDHQVIMIGYSDSNKDGGIAASRWGLFDAQRRLVETGRKHGVEVQFFHGRGGTVSRGGGNLVKGIEGAPPGTLGGYLRVTEQGEVINQKFGMRPLALRNLELVTGAVLRHQLSDTGQHPEPWMTEIMAALAESSRNTYRKLVFASPAFRTYFRQATPIDVIERLNIGSRPAARRDGQGIENLRAIPWVFSWAQVRIGLPGVFGMGTSLAAMTEQHGIGRLREMLARWSFFQGLVSDVEMVLAKSVLDIGARYAALAEPAEQSIFTEIQAEFALATRLILELKQARVLLEDQPTLQRNIRLRNPYADPLHLLQIDLLRRWRAGGREDPELLRALQATVNGIALAIQNTG